MVIGSENLMNDSERSKTRPIPQYLGKLSLNPLFEFEKDKEVLHICLRFPSKSYRREYEILEDYLPRELDISMKEWRFLRDQLENNGAAKELEHYVNRGILVTSPES